MAGSDRSQAPAAGAGAPAVILVEPQLGENIGMVARAMLNCGLKDLRLVAPREPWPNAKAVAAASGADPVLAAARLYPTTAAAIADLARVYATTARERDMTKPVVSPRAAAAAMRGFGAGCGLLFGKESRGLDNDDIALADAILAIPLNPGFSSLNLAMAVLLTGYEWWLAGSAAADSVLRMPPETRPATKAELAGLFEHLEAELDACGFLRVAHQRPTMVRNLRNLFGRANMTEQEVRTFRGIIACLVTGGPRRRPPATTTGEAGQP
ncbi:MAG: RNA methyltransferase [Rhodospirillales bacterium]|jgi:tRNA/rRNA methyltransferase|nr:RNA methyltransferase [Rhodospirillales bacterium]